MNAHTSGFAIHDEQYDTTLTTSAIQNSHVTTGEKQLVVSLCRCARRGSVSLAVGALALMSVVSSSACATAKAATPVERPALIVPPPPPRVITPAPLPEVQPAPEPLELPANTSKPPARPPRQQTQAAKDAAKGDAKVDPLPDAPATPVATPPPVPPPQLRMSEGTDTAATARQARDTIERTRRALNAIDPARLSADNQKVLSNAKAFTTQAEEALNAGNVVFAKELAEKAERLAKELQVR
ncbi:MAG TPA: hypothetical protein VKA59_15195 [Vicinamibacterales bacterium]|nr:hypothetical protein [Vicinamibacterales bacterium]